LKPDTVRKKGEVKEENDATVVGLGFVTPCLEERKKSPTPRLYIWSGAPEIDDTSIINCYLPSFLLLRKSTGLREEFIPPRHDDDDDR
jgi:hypothetical protein